MYKAGVPMTLPVYNEMLTKRVLAILDADPEGTEQLMEEYLIVDLQELVWVLPQVQALRVLVTRRDFSGYTKRQALPELSLEQLL